MQYSDKENYAKALAGRAEKCVKIIKCLLLASVALVVLVAVFTLAVFCTGAVSEHTETVLAVYIVAVALIAVLIAAVAVIYFKAKSYLKKLDNLDRISES